MEARKAGSVRSMLYHRQPTYSIQRCGPDNMTQVRYFGERNTSGTGQYRIVPERLYTRTDL